MNPRYQKKPLGIPFVKPQLFAALREKFQEGYSWGDLRSDLMSGIIVGMVAIPLGMALAIASGVSPQAGLYTVILAGTLVALLGGSRFQVSGPTAAFVVVLAPVALKFGLAGLSIAGLMAGVMLVLMGMTGMGKLIQFIPYPVTTGFTSGIAVVIATLQLKDFLGLHIERMPESYLEKVLALVEARGSFSWAALAVGAATLSLLLIWPRFNKRIPAPLVALTTVSVLTTIVKSWYPELDISTIGTRFSYQLADGMIGYGIPPTPPQFGFPWHLPGVNGEAFVVSWESIHSLLPSAFAIAMLAGIESLLSAVVADGLAQTKHNPDSELVAIGIGNILCPFFGGIAATGAIARTATNIRFGAKSPLSAAIHGLFVLLVVCLFSHLVSYLPMAALAALLLLVAYNMSEAKHFFHILKVAPRGDVLVLLTCFSLTVALDMVVGVTTGVVLAAVFFMKEMASETSGQMMHEGAQPHVTGPLPKEILFYEIAGPLFFGAAEKVVDAISGITDTIRVVVFDLEEVPMMDVTGLVAFESAVKKLLIHDRQVVVMGLRPQPAELFRNSYLLGNSDRIHFRDGMSEAIQTAKGLLAKGA